MPPTRASEPFFEELIEGLPEAMLVVERGRPHYIYVNAAAEQLLGYSREELLALGPGDVSAPESARSLGDMRDALESVGVWRGSWTLRRKDGRTVEIAGYAARRVVGDRVLYQGLARLPADAPAGCDSAPASAASAPTPEARLLEATGQAVIAADMAGIVTYWNRAAERFYGRPASEALGRSMLELIPAGPLREEGARTVGRILAGETVAGEMMVQRPDGTRFRALVTGSPIREADGRQVGILGVAVPADVATSTTPSVAQPPGMRLRRSLVSCAACGREVPGTARRRYCSEKCRQWAYYHRHIEEQRERSRSRHRQQSASSSAGAPDGGAPGAAEPERGAAEPERGAAEPDRDTSAPA